MPPSAKTIAYLRVSTIDQNLDKNRADILKLANEKGVGQVQFIEEQASGKISWHKRKIADILGNLVCDDNLIVSELSRLGRSMLECMEILSSTLSKSEPLILMKSEPLIIEKNIT